MKLPIYDGLPLYGYVRMRADAPSTGLGNCCERLLSEQAGDVYRWGGDHYGRTTLKTMTTDTTVVLTSGEVFTNCIMVKRVDGLMSHYFNIASAYHLTFYAPNVGLIKEVFVSPGNGSQRELVDHWIAP